MEKLLIPPGTNVHCEGRNVIFSHDVRDGHEYYDVFCFRVTDGSPSRALVRLQRLLRAAQRQEIEETRRGTSLLPKEISPQTKESPQLPILELVGSR